MRKHSEPLQLVIGDLTTTLIPGTHETELEIHAPLDSLGYNVTVHYNKNRPGYGVHFENVVHYNCTEIHWLYNRGQEWDKDDRVALESDVHGTGGTREINHIDKIVIVKATEKHSNW